MKNILKNLGILDIKFDKKQNKKNCRLGSKLKAQKMSCQIKKDDFVFRDIKSAKKR